MTNLFVVRNKTNRQYLGRYYSYFTDFDHAKFYQTKNPATSALNNLVRHYNYKAEDLEVIPVSVVEPE